MLLGLLRLREINGGVEWGLARLTICVWELLPFLSHAGSWLRHKSGVYQRKSLRACCDECEVR